MTEAHEYSYNPGQLEAIPEATQQLVEICQRMNDGQPIPDTIKQLYALYFDYQETFTGTPTGHILRTLPEDLVIEYDIDTEVSWGWYQSAMAKHQRRTAMRHDRAYLRSIGSPLASGPWLE